MRGPRFNPVLFKHSDWFVLLVIALSLAAVFLPMLGRVGNPVPDPRWQQIKIITIAVTSYHRDHGDWPESLDFLEEETLYLNRAGHELPLLENISPQHAGYRFERPEVPLDSVQDMSVVPILWELRHDGTIDPDGCIGYADGHVEGPRDRSNDPVLPWGSPVE